jgi:hypothetical protein
VARIIGAAVTALPPPLAAWASELAVLASDLALALAPWLGRLAVALGPLADAAHVAAGEPDGYRGLTRRGSYERLLATEWGMAELFPDEFLRRAATGEHLFVELARRTPHRARHSFALISAGPSQLGAPRLAHLAALIVLARRAAAAGAELAWGVLEDPSHLIHRGLDEAALRELLDARTRHRAPPAAIAAWFARLDDARDAWLIGGDDTTAHAPTGVSQIAVREPFEPALRALDLEIRHRGRTTPLRLALPPADACVRLIRDPFPTRAAPRVHAATTAASEIAFTPRGTRLLVRLTGGNYEALQIPEHPGASSGGAKWFTPPHGGVVVATGFTRRAQLAVIADATGRAQLRYGNQHPLDLALPEAVQTQVAARIAEGQPLRVGTCFPQPVFMHQRNDLVFDVLGALCVVRDFTLWPSRGRKLTAEPCRITPEQTAAPAAALALYDRNLLHAQHGNGEVVHVSTSYERRVVARLAALPYAPVHFGCAFPARAPWGVVAAAKDERTWSVASPARAPTALTSDEPVIGVAMRDGVPALITHPHHHRFTWKFGGTSETIAAGAPIRQAIVCANQPYLAWLTVAGEAVVYSLQYRTFLLRRTPRAAP